MTKQLRIRPKAQRDLEELALHIALDSVDAALRFEVAAIETAQDMLELPEAYPVIDLEVGHELGLRKRHVRGFPNHLIFYTVTEHAVIIERFIHGARNLPAVLREESDL